MKAKSTLIVCDVQPDVVRKLPHPRLFVDLVNTAVEAARRRSAKIVFTMIKFDEPGYVQTSPSHPRLGVLRRLHEKNPNLKWFTSPDLSILPQSQANNNENETVVTRCTFLPQATHTNLIQALDQQHDGFFVVGYGPTVQAMCHLLGDVLAAPNVQILKECVADENADRCQWFLKHGLLFNEQVGSLVDFLDAMDLLHDKIDISTVDPAINSSLPENAKYVSDCGRGGHLSLFMTYLLRDHGYCRWPTQPWYVEMALTSNKEYQCPLGRRIVHLCDEPQFGSGTRFFLAGREHLDEKDLLYQLAPEMMPPTFESIEAAHNYAAQATSIVWFLKKVNQNGGRAVTVTNELPTEPLAKDEQLQAHVPRPLLYYEDRGQGLGKFKCHVKTYQYIACTTVAGSDPPATAWQLYMHDLFYLATASHPWSPEDLSDDAQITTMRTHRLYPDNPWRLEWKLTEKCRVNMQKVLQRAVEQGKLYQPKVSQSDSPPHQCSKSKNQAAALQFEVNSADWMLDEDGRMYLIECNGIPVLYDAGQPQELVTKGLKLYDKLYKENPDTAVVNDHDLLQEAVGLAITGKLPKSSLWKYLATFRSPVE